MKKSIINGITFTSLLKFLTFPGACHMFGVKDDDWPSIVLAMFAESRKLDKLILDNHPYSDFLSAESENALRKVSHFFAEKRRKKTFRVVRFNFFDS